MTYGDNGAEFIMTSEGLAATITSTDYIFFGKVIVWMRAANGTGVVSSFVMESDDLDEIDWVWKLQNLANYQLTFHRNGLVEMLRLLRPTTLARATPQPTTVPHIQPLTILKMYGINTQSTGHRNTSNGTSTTPSSAPYSTPTLLMARTSPKHP
jgi:hypothetical protein